MFVYTRHYCGFETPDKGTGVLSWVTCTMPWIVMSGEVGFWVTTATVNMLVVSANSL